MQSFRRSFIWFHHIYSNKKQKAIARWSSELNISGIMRTGKPGVMLVEGDLDSVNRFVVQIKALNWQKMTVNVNEDFLLPKDWEGPEKEWIKSMRKFESLERHDTEKLLQLLPIFDDVGLSNFFWEGTRMDPTKYSK